MPEKLEVKVRRLGDGADLPLLPTYATAGASGLDLYSPYTVRIWQGGLTLVGTKLSLEIPPGFEGQIRIRSSLALKGLIIPNAPATIDSDYRGEVKVPLVSLFGLATIKKGERFAQLVIAPVTRAVLVEGQPLSLTDRGDGGFGSTGA